MFLFLNLETKIKKKKNVMHKKIEVGIFDTKHSNPPAIIEKNAIKLAIKLLLFQILKTPPKNNKIPHKLKRLYEGVGIQ